MKASINILVTFILVSVVLGLFVGVSSATWCDTDSAKRIDVNVNNTGGGALTNYQVYINLTDNPINESSLRVYNATSCTLRSHWCENETGGNCYGVWINYSAVAASIWVNNTAIYYDNIAASSVSNGTNTFLLFDDFNDGSINTNLWTTHVGGGSPTFTEANGYLKILAEDSADNGQVYTNNNFTDVSFRWRHKAVDDSNTQVHASDMQTGISQNGERLIWVAASSVWKFDKCVAGSYTDIGATSHDTASWWIGDLCRNATLARVFLSDVQIGSDQTVNAGAKYLVLWALQASELRIDWALARKYATIDLSTTLGTEESSIILTLTTPTEGQGLSTATIWINGTTNANATINFSVDAGANDTACTDCTSFTNLTSTLSEGSHNVTVYAINYTDSSDTDTKTRNFTINSLVPQWGNQTQNVSFIYHNGSINLSANGYDATGLNYTWLATNETGTWQNFTTADATINDYQILSQTYTGTQSCCGTFRITGYSEVTGDYSKFLFHHTPTGTPGQVIGWRYYYPANDTWGADHVAYDAVDTDASSLTVINATRWMYSYRDITAGSLHDIWTNDGGATWSSPVASPFNGVTTWVKYIPIDGDTSKVYVFWVPTSDSTHIHQKFFYLGNETYSADLVAWTLASNDNEITGKVVLVNGIYYVHTASDTGYAQYRTSTDIKTWSGSISSGIPRYNGWGYSVDCDDNYCYMTQIHTDRENRFYSINKSELNTTNWTYRLDLNVSNLGLPTLKVINNTHIITTAQENVAQKQYARFVKTHTITNSQYGSPINLGGSTNWEWANFTWQNSDYNDTTIYWKICFNDTSGLTNCTDVMSFDILDNSILHIDNVINIKEDWGRDFNSNLSANVTTTNASGVWMNFTNAEFTNTSLGWLNLTLDEWVNESHNVNAPVTNVSVTAFLNASGATNDSDSFYYVITNRTNTATMDSSATQNANTSESFYVNATCNEEYSDTFYGGANLLEDGDIVATDSSVTDYVNFSHSESSAGQYNYTIRFYNLTHYDNTTTPTYSNVTVYDVMYEPPDPTNLQNTTGNFWVNHTWIVGTPGNVTDSYNVSVYPGWYNTTLVTYYNDSGLTPHDWNNISVWAYNNSGNGTLSIGNVSDDVQIPNNVVALTITQNYNKLETETVFISDTSSSDADGDTPTYSCNRTDLFIDYSTVTGYGNWTTGISDAGTYYIDIGVSDGWGSSDNKTLTITINDATPGTPSGLANTTGNFWVNHTWSAGANTDTFNISVNSTWTNDTSNEYYNNTDMIPHNWSNITVYGFNSTSSELSGSTSQNTQIPNNVPVLSGLPNNTTTEDINQTDIFDLDDYFTDVDSDTPTYLVESNNQSSNVSVTINASNNVSYTLASGWNSTASVVINVTDGWGGEDNDTFLIVVNAAAGPGDYVPPNPTTLANTTGNYYVNYTWVMGTPGNITDSYNVSWNLSWYNNTLTTYMQKEVGASNWGNITVYAYNTSGSGSLSANYITDNVQAPAYVPNDYIPSNSTTLQNTTGNYYVNYTWIAGGGVNITDSYNVSWNLTWYNTTLTAYMQKEVGAEGWANITVYAYNSSGSGSLSTGYLSDETQAPAAAPVDYPPATPTTLANTSGNGWVHYTWSSGGGANITDSYNVSWNLTWYNTTLVTYMNDTVGEFGWANISVWAYNSTGNGSLSAGSVSSDTQAGGGTFTTSMTTTVYNLITYYGANSSAEQFGLDIGSVDYIAMYNGSFYSHTMGFSANNFTVYHGISYYAYLNASGSSTYQRNNIYDTPYNTQLFNRWNTIGWTNATNTNAEGIASSIGGTCKYTSSLNVDGVTYITHTVGFTSNNHVVEKGKGYWVWVNASGAWNRNS